MLYGTDIALGCGALTLLIALFGLGVSAPKPAAESDKETLLENGGPSTGTTPAGDRHGITEFTARPHRRSCNKGEANSSSRQALEALELSTA